MDAQEIRAAIAADPSLQALVPDAVALAAHATFAGHTTVGMLSAARFAQWAVAAGMRGKIEDISATSGHPLRDSALAMRDVLGGSMDGIDLSDASNQAVVSAWITAGELSQGAADMLYSMASHADPVSELAIRQAIYNNDGSLAV